jgi:hypothetical protein
VRRLARRAALSLEIAGIYPRAWWLLHNRELPATLRVLRPGGSDGDPGPQGVSTAAFLGHAVTRLLSHLPVDSRCLIRSLVLTRMLDRRGIPSLLVIGVNPGETLAAHAWVEVCGHAVLPAGEFAERRLAQL